MTNIWQKSIKEVKVKKQYIPESLPKLTPRQGPWPIDVPVPQGVKLVAMLWPYYEDDVSFCKSKPWTRMTLQLVGNQLKACGNTHQALCKIETVDILIKLFEDQLSFSMYNKTKEIIQSNMDFGLQWVVTVPHTTGINLLLLECQAASTVLICHSLSRLFK
jgi:hypothetical protein